MATDLNAATKSSDAGKALSTVRLLLRSAAVFGVVGLAGFLMYFAVDGDDPARSDDPYLVGMMLGFVAAAAAAFYTMLEVFVRRRVVVDLLYFGLLGLWAVFVAASTWFSLEGQEMGLYVAGASLIAGTLGWPFCRFRIPRTLAILATAGGVVMVAAYVVVALRMGRG
jgi:hypothetical protein